MRYITMMDYVLLPFVLMVVYGIAYRIRDKYYPRKHPWRKYFIPGLTVKIFGAIFIGMIYQYYYGGGDTFNFFAHTKVINSAWDESVVKWWNLVWHIPERTDGNYYQYMIRLWWYDDLSSYAVSAFAAVLGLFTFTTYLPTAVLFAAISFTGVWALFRSFANLYPKFVKPVAIATLFIPSTFVWGSAIFKDTLCMFGLGWLTYSIFRLLIKKDFSAKNIIIGLLSAWLISVIKLYILVSFIPALAFWLLFIYLKNIKQRAQRILARFVMLGIVIGVFFVMAGALADEMGKYSLENLANTAAVTSGWTGYASGDEGASYSLGTFDPSIAGMISKMPMAIITTLFRPFLWEAGKVIVLFSALEALLFLFITLKVLFSVGLTKSWQTISTDPTIQFCFIFAIIFAFAVGISTGNFGALSRYKIPCLPFYALGILLIYYKNNAASKRILPFL
jgi:hypothetical protein